MNFDITLRELKQLIRHYHEKIDKNDTSELKFVERKGGVKGMIQGLFTHQNKGIRSTSVQQRISVFGSNQNKPKKSKTFCTLLLNALDDFILKILMVSSIASMVIQTATATAQDRETAWIEGFSILLAVIVCSSVTAINDYQKEIQFAKLNEISQKRKIVNVMRDNEMTNINHSELVTGDILFIREGMEIPVDGWLLEASEMFVDESSMTGESEPVNKNTIDHCNKVAKSHLLIGSQRNHKALTDNPSPVMISGTKISSGEGKMLCLVVGEESCLGKIQRLIEERTQQSTPLQMKLQNLAADIGKFGLYAALAIVLALLIRFTVQRLRQRLWITSIHLPQILSFFVLGITVIVVAIPQGLPLAVTLTLAYSVKKMLMDNNLVRRMEACETMGGANIICSDKTGTLTMNKMSVDSWWNTSLQKITHYTDIGCSDQHMNKFYRELLLVNLLVNSSTELRPILTGSATQIALMQFGERFDEKYEVFRKQYPVLIKFPFTSTRKRMSIVTQMSEERYLLMKGASQIILQNCTSWISETKGEIQQIDQHIRIELALVISNMAEKGLRTIALAYKQIEKNTHFNHKNKQGVYDIEKNHMILIAIIGVRDLPRQQVPEALVQCKRAGIKVKMVTGDNLVTATAIAKQIGIIVQGQPSMCMEGPEFNKIIGGIVCKQCRTQKCDCSQDPTNKSKPLRKDVIKNAQDFQRIVKHLDVLARSRPEDKYALVTGLKNLGNVVAVTGDGTNDAPALRKADVGFAMGISGTEVAREASSIVLLDDNFNSIVKSVMWGRNIYDSIKKFIQFQLTVNVVAVTITLVGAAVLKQSILSPVQMLWINMIMDSLASLALATEPPNEQLLDRMPHSRDQYLITKKMWKHIIFQGTYQLIILMILVFLGEFIITESPDDFDIALIHDHNLAYKYRNGIVTNGHIVSGRMIDLYNSGTTTYQTIFNKYGIYSRHFTFIFNTFVFMQVFNFFNCRKLQDQFNVFAGILNNQIFILVFVIIVVLQVLIVTFGSIAFGLYSFYGLNKEQWILSISFGVGSLAVSILAKLFPEAKWCQDAPQQRPEDKFPKNRAFTLALKKKITAEDNPQSNVMLEY